MKKIAALMFAIVSIAGYGQSLLDRISAEHKVLQQDVWYGYTRIVFEFEGHQAWIVEPKGEWKEGHPWTWTMQWAEAFVERTGVLDLLAKGWCHVTIDTFKHRMDDEGLRISRAFQKHLVERFGFASKARLVGMSWGGFFSIRYATAFPECVDRIYLDAPLLTLGGGFDARMDVGPWAAMPPNGGDWLADPRMPVNMGEKLAKDGIPILLLYGGQDQTVDPTLNCEPFAARFKAAGGSITILKRPAFGHHPHGEEVGKTAPISDFLGKDQWLALLPPPTSAVACSDTQEDQRDPRIRTFVYPRRIVWHSSAQEFRDGWPARCDAQKTELLMEAKSGQVCEGAFGKSCGTKLINCGEPAGMILDFGRELHGGIELGMSPSTVPFARLRIRFGESVSETSSSIGDGKHATNDHALRDFELPVPRFGSIEVGNTGFRFVRIDLVSGGEAGFEFIRAVSLMRPMKVVGSFKSSDERLNGVFDTAVRTVHLCCQEYLWDGIKRDRLVWAGDMHTETKAILNVFGAEKILSDSLDYLAATTPPDKWMHSMATYTLWWIRNLAEWCRYTGDMEYARRHADYLEKTFAHVESGMKDGEWRAGNFLDWPTRHNEAGATAGTQGLALETARDVEFLAEAAGRDALAARARAFAAELARLKPDPCGAKSAAAMLALSGLRDPKEMFAQVLGQNGHDGVSTFYGYYMVEAMSAASQNQRALDTVRDYWGAMLDVGATSFWENFDIAWTNNSFRIDEMPVAGKADIHGDYGEFCYPGFRHSLCHGWSSGPAAWCINHVLGIRPLDVGCKTVEVKPFLGDLEWAEGAMALPDGNAVKVKLTRLPDGKVDVRINSPDWVRIVE